MSKHYANAVWNGNLAQGKGKYELKTNGLTGQYGFPSRFENDKSQSSPEELIGAACASCFSMALAHELHQAGFNPESIQTEATVTLDKVEGGFGITEIALATRGQVPKLEADKFLEFATGAKENCPVSQALKATNITLASAKLV
ncbi:MAG: OsmC family peroxiredoxin [Saprospirales bacterium]|nr:MAG: OsmC family peroxiredoxin [Saprospirales bacterium]